MATTPDAATLTDWYKEYSAMTPGMATPAPAAPATPAALPTAAPTATAAPLPAPMPSTAPSPAPASSGMLAMPQATTTQWTPDEKSTVAGQLKSITQAGSPLLDQAETAAKQQMNARGLLNSSIAITAGQDALYRAALPIAQQDAQTFGRAGEFNASAANSTSQFNTGVARDVGMQQAGFQQQTSERVASQDFQAKERALTEAGVNNRFDREMAMRSEQFNVEQAAADRRLATQHSNELERMGFANDLAKANVPSAFAAQVSSETAAAVNAILADPNISPEDKKGAIQNAVTYANSRLTWASTFYNTVFPQMTAPGAAPAPAPFVGPVNPATPGSGGVSPGAPQPGAPSPGGAANPRDQLPGNLYPVQEPSPVLQPPVRNWRDKMIDTR